MYVYVSMPYIFEEAIIEIYKNKGWDLATTINCYLESVNSEEFFDYIPTLRDIHNKIIKIKPIV